MQCRVLAFSGIFCVASLGALVSCADDEHGHSDPCIFVISPEECDQEPSGDDLAHEDDPNAPSCTTEPDGLLRTVFQCNGHVKATIQFHTLIGDCPQLLGKAQACQQSHEFGVGLDPYEMPSVMACCDAEGVPEDEVLVYCAADMVDQVCRSIPLRMQELIDGESLDGKKVAKKQAQALQGWLAANPQKCREALLHHSEVPGIVEARSFKAPNSSDWKLIKDFTITLNEAVVESTSLPEDPAEQLACSDSHFNDTELFQGAASGTTRK